MLQRSWNSFGFDIELLRLGFRVEPVWSVRSEDPAPEGADQEPLNPQTAELLNTTPIDPKPLNPKLSNPENLSTLERGVRSDSLSRSPDFRCSAQGTL